jgi:hypothetical protein
MTKKSKSKRKTKSSSSSVALKKMSEMVIQFAADYIRLGNNLEERQSYLNAACTAWNISILPLRERTAALDEFLRHYQQINLGINADDVENLKRDMETLIEEKLKLFQNAKRKIVEAKITERDGEEVVSIVSEVVRPP